MSDTHIDFLVVLVIPLHSPFLFNTEAAVDDNDKENAHQRAHNGNFVHLFLLRGWRLVSPESARAGPLGWPRGPDVAVRTPLLV